MQLWDIRRRKDFKNLFDTVLYDFFSATQHSLAVGWHFEHGLTED